MIRCIPESHGNPEALCWDRTFGSIVIPGVFAVVCWVRTHGSLHVKLVQLSYDHRDGHPVRQWQGRVVSSLQWMLCPLFGREKFRAELIALLGLSLAFSHDDGSSRRDLPTWRRNDLGEGNTNMPALQPVPTSLNLPCFQMIHLAIYISELITSLCPIEFVALVEGEWSDAICSHFSKCGLPKQWEFEPLSTRSALPGGFVQWLWRSERCGLLCRPHLVWLTLTVCVVCRGCFLLQARWNVRNHLIKKHSGVFNSKTSFPLSVSQQLNCLISLKIKLVSIMLYLNTKGIFSAPCFAVRCMEDYEELKSIGILTTFLYHGNFMWF